MQWNESEELFDNNKLFSDLRSKIVWKVPSPGPGPSIGSETRKKARPLSAHRESGHPVQAIVAPQRRSNDVAKTTEEDQDEEYRMKSEAGIPDIPPLQLELHTTMVTQPSKRDAATQYTDSINSTSDKNTGTENNDDDEDDNGNDPDEMHKKEATRKARPCCPRKRVCGDNINQTTADSLNTNITHFVSTRYVQCRVTHKKVDFFFAMFYLNDNVTLMDAK